MTSLADSMIGFAPPADPKVSIAVVVSRQSLTTQGHRWLGPIVPAMLQLALG